MIGTKCENIVNVWNDIMPSDKLRSLFLRPKQKHLTECRKINGKMFQLAKTTWKHSEKRHMHHVHLPKLLPSTNLERWGWKGLILLLIFKVQERTKINLNWKSFQRLRKETDIWRFLRVHRYPTATNVNFTGQVNPSQLRQRPQAICVGLQPNIQQTALFEAFDPALQHGGTPLTFSHWVQQ